MTSVTVERDGAVASVVLPGPALSLAVKEGLLESLLAVAADDQVRAVVLTGTGRAFCVGQDLAEHAAALGKDPATALDTVQEHYNPIVTALTTMPKPVVAGVNGTCVRSRPRLRARVRLRRDGRGRRARDRVHRHRPDLRLRALGDTARGRRDAAGQGAAAAADDLQRRAGGRLGAAVRPGARRPGPADGGGDSPPGWPPGRRRPTRRPSGCSSTGPRARSRTRSPPRAPRSGGWARPPTTGTPCGRSWRRRSRPSRARERRTVSDLGGTNRAYRLRSRRKVDIPLPHSSLGP